MSEELTERNFTRIYRLNWAICGPLLVLFGWPYYLVASTMLGEPVGLIGSFFFSLSFTLTIIHGHIAVAVGALQMETYHAWHQQSSGFFRFAFHPVLFSTRFRLLSLILSLLLVLAGYLI